MNKKILILSIFPAPYRSKLIDYFAEFYDVVSYYERNCDDNRNQNWFESDKKILTDESTYKEFNLNLHNLKQFSFVVLYDYTSTNSRRIIKMCKKNKVPYYVNCDGIIIGKRKNFLKQTIKRLLLNKVTGCFASGINATNYFLECGVPKEKIFLHTFSTLEKADILDEKALSLCPDSNWIRLKYGIPIDADIYLGVGRFFDIKNYYWLIEQWPINDKKHYLFLIGGGEEKELYQSYLEKHYVHNIFILDYLAYDSLKRYYQSASFFIHPTKYDAWGLVINEAMANGCPVISSNKCVAALELINNKQNGFIFDFEKTNLLDVFREVDGLSIKERYQIRHKALLLIQNYTIKNMSVCQLSAIKTTTGEK